MITQPPATDPSEDAELILAAEECEKSRFTEMHTFLENDNRIIQKLTAHGPVLLQGGRGAGKSALMIATSLSLSPANPDAHCLGLYVSLRYVPLLRASGAAYERLFCEWVGDRLGDATRDLGVRFSAKTLRTLKSQLTELATSQGKRIVLLFDDVAHIGRESSLESFFDIFRTLSSDTISCKASIYPGVTEFGTRFDVYNDATLISVARPPFQAGFEALFTSIMRIRVPGLAAVNYSNLSPEKVAAFLATAVLGNVRGFIFACNYLLDATRSSSGPIGYTILGSVLLKLATEYYWPLLDEVQPKLGKYTPAVAPAKAIAELFFKSCAAADGSKTSVLLHRNLVAAHLKPLEILEYAGFIAKREASRAMRSGGRGTRYALNLCNLLEMKSGARLTAQLYHDWTTNDNDAHEIHEKNEPFNQVQPAAPKEGDAGLAILEMPVNKLRKSVAYPYGLTDLKITRLEAAGIKTVKDLATASDDRLLAIDGVGLAFLRRFRNTVEQAIWM